MKECVKCGPEIGPLPDGAFFYNIHHKDKLDSYCKRCRQEYVKEWRRNNRDKVAFYQTLYRREQGVRPQTNRTGYRGVRDATYWSTTARASIPKFQAYLYHHGKQHSLGYFDHAEDAARAYDDEVRRLGLNRVLNFVG